jgi:phosphoglycerol transferase MdoB-like AlkP superfamily enzyme
MDDFAQFYQEGGFFMHPILLLGMLSMTTGLLALVVRRRATGILALIVGLLCLAVGVGAYALGVVEVMQATATVARDQYEMARDAGMHSAMIPMKFAAVCAAPGLLGGLLGLTFARRAGNRGR